MKWVYFLLDIGFVHNWERYAPGIVEEMDIDDDMSEPDSDEELELETFTGAPMELDDFLQEIEEGDSAMDELRKRKTDIFSELEIKQNIFEKGFT
jgi:hypothetical protein